MKYESNKNSVLGTLATPSLSDEEIARDLAQRCEVEFVRLLELDLSPHVVQLLPQSLALRYQVVAVKLEAEFLYVAIANPSDLPALNQINLVTGFEIKPLVATEGDLAQVIKRYYGIEQETRQVLIDSRFHQGEQDQVDDTSGDLDLPDDAGEVVRLFNSIIKDAFVSQTSDIHLEPYADGMRVRFRVDGILQDIMVVPLSMVNEIISRVKIMSKMDITEKRRPQDGHIELKHKGNEYDMRVSVTPTINGEKIVIRVLDRNSSMTTLPKLGLVKDEIELLENTVNMPHGMILVTGPTGCGKTTTLYAMLQSIDSTEKNIITIENPAEYKLERINQIQIEPSIDQTFASMLRCILRQDPDVIMVGEIRDQETAEISIQAALTGHFVLTTLHTNDAATAVTRLRDLGVAPFLISSSVVMSVSQRLLRRICPECKCSYTPLGEDMAAIGTTWKADTVFYHGTGCAHCFGSGYRGRVGCYEILRIEETLRSAIMEEVPASRLKNMAIENGMMKRSLFQAALQNVYDGVTTINEMQRTVALEV